MHIAIENDSYSFFGPLGMAIHDNGQALDDSDELKIMLSVYLTVIMILSIVGNVCTCAVIARDSTMRTPTNCYLFNLAITDFFISLFIPLEIYMLWVPEFYPMGLEGCQIHFFLMDCLFNCSVLTISAFTIERYLVVSRPFLRQKLSKISRVYKIVAVIWVVACSFCIPDVFFTDLMEKKKYIFCYFTPPEELRILMGVELLVFFVIPVTIIFVLYVLMVVKLKSIQKLRSSPVNGNQNRDKAVKVLGAVAGSFFFTWTPYSIFRIMMLSPVFSYENYYDAWRILNYVVMVNGYMSTAVNPILYSLISQNFRHAFKDFLKGRRVSRTPLCNRRIALQLPNVTKETCLFNS